MKRTALVVFSGLFMRVAAYAALLAGVTVLMHQGAHWPYEMSFYGENGLIEWLQVTFLVISIAVLWRCGSIDRDRRQVMIVLGLLLAATIAREWDKICDAYFCRHAWKVISGSLIAAAAWVAVRKSGTFYRAALHLTRQPSFGIMLTGGLIVLIFSRLFGAGDFWDQLIEENRGIAREVKKVAEECTELMGYFFIMTGTLEHWHETRIRKRKRLP